MLKKIAILTTGVIALAALVIVMHGNAGAAPKPVEFELDRKYDHSDAQIKEKLKSGWMLGGVYKECGQDFGEVEMSGNAELAMLPVYKKLLDLTKEEMIALLRKTNDEKNATAAMQKIAEGKERLTKYGTLPEYAKLQDRYDKLVTLNAEIGSKMGRAGGPSVADLIAKIEKFNQSGDKMALNDAKKAVMLLNKMLDYNSEALYDPNKDVDANLESLEKTRAIIADATAKFAKTGSGCQMVYVYYKQIK